MARFVQADSIVPEALSSQALNRYSYCINNPLKFTDPTGQSWWHAVVAAFSAIASWLSSPAGVAAIIGASIGAGIAAATGGDVLKGALTGAIGGMFGVGGCPVLAVAGGAVGALVTGGDPMMGAMTAGIAAGVSASFGISPLAGVFGDVEHDYLAALMFSTASGSLSGGVTAEIFGGNFGRGALRGAMGAAAGYVIGNAIKQHIVEKNIIKQAIEDAKKQVDKAMIETVKSFWDKSANAEFKKWFGTDDFMSKLRVLRKYYMTRVALDQPISWARGVYSGAIAYVNPYDSQVKVYLCKIFFRLPADYRAGVVIHELTHEVAGTNVNAPYRLEHYYGDALTLAQNSPIYAQHNADNYRQYALSVYRK